MTAAAAESSVKILNPARLAVLESCEDWDHWTERPQWVVKSDSDCKYFFQQDAMLSRTPIVTAFWNDFNPEWWVHAEQEWRAPLDVSIWLPENRHTLAENMLEDAIDAVYRHPDSTSTAAQPLSRVKKVTGCHPAALLAVNVTAVQTGDEAKHRLLRAYFTIQLRMRKDPIQRATA